MYMCEFVGVCKYVDVCMCVRGIEGGGGTGLVYEVDIIISFLNKCENLGLKRGNTVRVR